jgi:hypothetical protein
MLPAHIAPATLQNALFPRFKNFAGYDCNYYNRMFCFFEDPYKPLEEVTLQITSDSSCNTTYSGYITDRMIFAGDPNGGKGACWVIAS